MNKEKSINSLNFDRCFFLLQSLYLRIVDFCGINFCEYLSLKNFAGLIFTKGANFVKISIAKIYIARFYPTLISISIGD